MQQQRPHHQCIARLRKASLFVDPHRRSILRPDDTQRMRIWHNMKRPIIRTAVVEMHTHRDHLFEKRKRRLHIPAILFQRPASQALCLRTLAHRDAQVLVNRHQPIDGPGFFKQGALHSDMTGRKNPIQTIVEEDVTCEFGTPWLREQSARTSTTDGRKLPDQARALRGVEQPWKNVETVPLEKTQGLA